MCILLPVLIITIMFLEDKRPLPSLTWRIRAVGVWPLLGLESQDHSIELSL
jgi:hypothetical protein